MAGFRRTTVQDLSAATTTQRPLSRSRTGAVNDADALAYLRAVETADGQRLEAEVRLAVERFIVGCKADGIWTAIKASCILAGARTLSGALVPLVGTAPTNSNFVSGDYNRKTGLAGNASNKYLNSNRNNNADPQDNVHAALYVSTPDTGGSSTARAYLSGANAVSPNFSYLSLLRYNSAGGLTGMAAYVRSQDFVSIGDLNTSGFLGVYRSGSTTFNSRAGTVDIATSSTSRTPGAFPVAIFAENYQGTIGSYSNVQLAFYSLGESLDLALLDARVTRLISAFAQAIP
jgi:hypothetical protein